MKKKVLLVGLEYSGDKISDTEIETKGLCRPEIEPSKAADALYDYDVIIINPESYSHFIFGKASEYSKSDKELWDLKNKNNDYDLEVIFDYREREAELNTALKNGTFVIWMIVPDKKMSFFGQRSLFSGYINNVAEKAISTAIVYQKKSKKLHVASSGKIFDQYFEQLKTDGWRTCFSRSSVRGRTIAKTPEGHILCFEVTAGKSKAWLMASPYSDKGINTLVKTSIKIKSQEPAYSNYHGIFLSHTNTDKPFVRKLKKSLERHGVQEIWIDEAEIQVGDSLMKKIEEGISKTKYIAVVLSPDSISSNWVAKELNMAINREVESGEVVVLPILYKKCELPGFLDGKVYADFTTSAKYKESLKKLLRRLRK